MRLRALLLSSILGLAAAGGAALLACGASDFDPPSLVQSVRMFGVRADKPYANAGDVVTLEVLATDGRRPKPGALPLKIYWIPFVCVNPREDLYYLCFVPGDDGGIQGDGIVPAMPGGGGVDAGALPPGLGGGGGGALANLPTGIDLGPFLPQGNTFSFRMPDGVVKERVGSVPYGLALVFNIACAGQVRIRERGGPNPQQVPVRCTDAEGNDLGPDDYVIGISRIYSYPDRTNANPVVESVTVDGVPVDPKVGLVMDRCTAARRADCPAKKIDVKVPESSWELNPSEGANPREQIWVTYYADLGQLEDNARLLYDPNAGRVSESDVELRAPGQPGDGTLWAVVHDNRVGAAFVVLPVHIR